MTTKRTRIAIESRKPDPAPRGTPAERCHGRTRYRNARKAEADRYRKTQAGIPMKHGGALFPCTHCRGWHFGDSKRRTATQ